MTYMDVGKPETILPPDDSKLSVEVHEKRGFGKLRHLQTELAENPTFRQFGFTFPRSRLTVNRNPCAGLDFFPDTTRTFDSG